MFVRLLVTYWCFTLVLQLTLISSSKGQNTNNLKLQKPELLDDDADLNDPRILGNDVEGSGGAASLDEYADDEEEEELSKITAKILSTTISTTIKTTTMMMTTTTTTTLRTTIATTKRTTTTTKPTLTTTPLVPLWAKHPANSESRSGKTRISSTRITTTTLSMFNDMDGNEFKDDLEDYPDDPENDIDYNEISLTTKFSTTSSTLTTRNLYITTRETIVQRHRPPIWIFFNFLKRDDVKIGIFTGLAIGIFTSIILLICIIQRYHKRDKSHSSYTTGLLYPHQYGYSKSPQEFYA